MTIVNVASPRLAAGAIGVAVFGGLIAGSDAGAGMPLVGWMSCGVLLPAWRTVLRGIRASADAPARS